MGITATSAAGESSFDVYLPFEPKSVPVHFNVLLWCAVAAAAIVLILIAVYSVRFLLRRYAVAEIDSGKYVPMVGAELVADTSDLQSAPGNEPGMMMGPSGMQSAQVALPYSLNYDASQSIQS